MAKLKVPVNDNDHITGNKNARVELVEYGDYQCPHCGSAHPKVKRIIEKMGNDIKFIFRNFPLATLHPQAKQAAQAAESAGAQGKFWEMHDLLFENQKNLQNSDLESYAEQLGIDVEEFKNDMDNQAYLRKVESDFESGVRSGVNSTPTFYINGERFDGELNEESIQEILSIHQKR